MLTIVLSKVFTQLNIASKFLQGKETDLEKATTILQKCKAKLKNMRQDYAIIKEEAVNLAKVQPLVKKHFDEQANGPQVL